jgi:pentapeptide MXKDX repeat protein
MSTMIESGRSWLAALVVGVPLVVVGGAWAQSDTMKKDSMQAPMKKDDMKDGMGKDGTMKGADKAMKKGEMKKDDAMKKGEMKGDAMMEKKP